MADGRDQSELRSTANRVSSLVAGQEQLQMEVAKLRNQAHAILVLTVYGVALSVLLGLAIYSLSKAVKA